MTTNLEKWLASLSPQERHERLSAAGKSVKRRRNLFTENSDRAKECGRAGGKQTAIRKSTTDVNG